MFSASIPHLPVYGLVIAYAALVVLLLGLNLLSRWNWFVKLCANVLCILLCVVTYHSWPGLLGWPTARDLPENFYLHAVQVEEPQVIYIWGTDLSRGLGRTVPRSFALPYSAQLHDKVDKASRKLRKGLPVIGQVSTTAAPVQSVATMEQIRTNSADINFIDAPQALIPGKN